MDSSCRCSGFTLKMILNFSAKSHVDVAFFRQSQVKACLAMKQFCRSPHGGGKRMENGSYEYNLLVQWIEQGMPYGTDADPFGELDSLCS